MLVDLSTERCMVLPVGLLDSGTDSSASKFFEEGSTRNDCAIWLFSIVNLVECTDCNLCLLNVNVKCSTIWSKVVHPIGNMVPFETQTLPPISVPQAGGTHNVKQSN